MTSLQLRWSIAVGIYVKIILKINVDGEKLSATMVKCLQEEKKGESAGGKKYGYKFELFFRTAKNDESRKRNFNIVKLL